MSVDLALATIARTGAAAVLFAAVFINGGRVHPLRAVVHDDRVVISFCAGMSAAYVFVHLMPELHEARVTFTDSVKITLHHQGMAIYFLALVGFLCFYGLEHLHARLLHSDLPEQQGRAFRVQIGGFAAYVGLTSYLLVRGLEDSAVLTALYAAAFACHFLTLDHALQERHAERYARVGRWLLAAMCLLGWGLGVLFALPHVMVAMLVAFISGAVIVNSAVMELPSDKDGRFLPFVAGGLLYALLLLPLS